MISCRMSICMSWVFQRHYVNFYESRKMPNFKKKSYTNNNKKTKNADSAPAGPFRVKRHNLIESEWTCRLVKTVFYWEYSYTNSHLSLFCYLTTTILILCLQNCTCVYPFFIQFFWSSYWLFFLFCTSLFCFKWNPPISFFLSSTSNITFSLFTVFTDFRNTFPSFPWPFCPRAIFFFLEKSEVIVWNEIAFNNGLLYAL